MAKLVDPKELFFQLATSDIHKAMVALKAKKIQPMSSDQFRQMLEFNSQTFPPNFILSCAVENKENIIQQILSSVVNEHNFLNVCLKTDSLSSDDVEAIFAILKHSQSLHTFIFVVDNIQCNDEMLEALQLLPQKILSIPESMYAITFNTHTDNNYTKTEAYAIKYEGETRYYSNKTVITYDKDIELAGDGAQGQDGSDHNDWNCAIM